MIFNFHNQKIRIKTNLGKNLRKLNVFRISLMRLILRGDIVLFTKVNKI